MRKLLIIFTFILATHQGLQSQQLYGIPDSLVKDADAIIISNEETLEIFDKYKVERTTNTKTLILNSESISAQNIFVPYNKFTEITDLSITITTPEGKKLKSIRKKEMMDQAAYDGITLASDYRFLMYKVAGYSPPYIIHTKYTVTYSQSFVLPGFSPFEGEKIALVQSKYTIKNHDVQNKVRFTVSPWGSPEVDSSTTTMHQYTWSFSNCKADKLKKLSNSSHNNFIGNILESFQMDGVEGSMSSWSSFGLWLDRLGTGMDKLDVNATNEIKKLIGDEQNQYKIVDKLYKYLQENMRYVSIQLGIGGFKPMAAQDVHNNKYGDCKALSNYMKAILNIAGISSKYLIIQAGNQISPIDINQPKNSFNHAILAVPNGADTIFLECTSQKNATGYQGSFTGNRYALMVDGEHSSLIKTTKYDHEDNKIISEYKINLASDSQQKVNMHQSLAGMGIEHHNLNFLFDTENKKMEDHMSGLLENVSQLKLLSTIVKPEGKYPSIDYAVEFVSPKKILKTGRRYMIELSMDKLPSSILSILDTKAVSFYPETGYLLQDKFNILLAPGCQAEQLPKDKNLTTDAGTFSIKSTIYQDNTLEIERTIVIKSTAAGQIASPEDINFYTIIRKSLAEKAVILCKADIKP